jgi:hypothetical protein
MSSSVYATFALELHARRWQTALALAAVGLCMLVPWCLTEMTFVFRLVLSVSAALLSLGGAWSAAWLPLRHRIVRMTCNSAEEWWLEDAAGRLLRARLHPRTRFFRRFIWLRFDSRHSLLLGPGDLAPEQFRRLQVLLRRQRVATIHQCVA